MLVDGLPQEQLIKYYNQYGEGGFKLLLDKGSWYGNAHYSHATTYTAVGHALLSCAHPYKHGVIGNDWLDKKTKQRVYSTEDARYKYLDEETPKHAGTSPFNIKVTAVGDELIYANGKSKVVAISGKDRSSIGLAGQNGVAYMYSTTAGRFITSDFICPTIPNGGGTTTRTSRRTGTRRPALDAAAARGGLRAFGPRRRPWSTNYKGIGTKFPHPIGGGPAGPSKTYYDAMMWTPFGDVLTLDFVKAAIEGRTSAGTRRACPTCSP